MGRDEGHPLIVVDTHAWLWWHNKPERLSRAAAAEISRARSIGVSAMSCWEVAMLERQNRLRLERGVLAWVRQALAHDRTQLLPVTGEIAVHAAAIGAAVPDPADGLIYATALEHGARLISRDARLKAHDPARVVW